MNNKEIAYEAARILDSKKGQDIVIIDISTVSAFADYLVIAHGNSDRQTKTLADEVRDRLAELEIFPKSIEGKESSGWILMDYGDIIINVFYKEQRERYNIEKIWGDGEFLAFDGTIE